MKKAWASYNNWESENLDVTFNKVYSCEIKDGAIVVEGALAAVSRVPLMKHTLTVTVHDDGVIDFSLRGNVRQNAPWLPRLGFEWTLPQDSSPRSKKSLRQAQGRSNTGLSPRLWQKERQSR